MNYKSLSFPAAYLHWLSIHLVLSSLHTHNNAIVAPGPTIKVLPRILVAILILYTRVLFCGVKTLSVFRKHHTRLQIMNKLCFGIMLSRGDLPRTRSMRNETQLRGLANGSAKSEMTTRQMWETNEMAPERIRAICRDVTSSCP